MLTKSLAGALLGIVLLAPFVSVAQEATPEPLPEAEVQPTLVTDTVTIAKARVIEVANERIERLPGTGVEAAMQTLTIEVLEGPEAGTVATFENDYTQLDEGDVFYVRHTTNTLDGLDMWAVSDPYRLPVLIALAAAFLVLLFLFGGIQGIRGLATLIGSLFLIFYLLLPGIYAGISPILVSIGVASIIIVAGSFITHGFNRATSAAVLGMIVTVLATGAAAFWAVDAAMLSGFTSEINAYLNFNTDGRISMVGLLFGGIMIGLLGVLYDIAIGQAVAVDELYRAAPHISRREAYRRGIRIGREHIGALVNTLAIAYVGASLPLLLLLRDTASSFAFVVNGELFATEIIRILIGSIGLILAVPLTTFIASRMLYGSESRNPSAHSHSH